MYHKNQIGKSQRFSMQFAIASEHLHFFTSHQYIEFDQLLSKEETTILAQETKNILTQRLSLSSQSLFPVSLQKKFSVGRDTWRENRTIKRSALSSRLAAIARELCKAQELRIAYDQVFYNGPISKEEKIGGSLPPYLWQPATLEESSCIQGITIALLLQLSPLDMVSTPSTPLSEEEDSYLTLRPRERGNGIFFQPNTPLLLKHLTTTSPCHQFLIAYCHKNSVYKKAIKDPHTHRLKKFGYVFGDRLTNATHPLLHHN